MIPLLRSCALLLLLAASCLPGATALQVAVTAQVINPATPPVSITDVWARGRSVPAGGGDIETRPQVRGLALPGATISILIDGVAVGSVVADGTGQWSYTPVLNLGQRQLTARDPVIAMSTPSWAYMVHPITDSTVSSGSCGAGGLFAGLVAMAVLTGLRSRRRHQR